jgi:hypothetical protein
LLKFSVSKNRKDSLSQIYLRFYLRFYLINNLTTTINIVVCKTTPPIFGHPSLSAILNPKEDVKASTASYKNGEDINKNNRPPIRDTIHLSFDVYGFKQSVDPSFLDIKALIIRVYTPACNNNPAKLGHPTLSDISKPILDVIPLTRENVYGDATSKNTRPDIIDTVHLSEDV